MRIIRKLQDIDFLYRAKAVPAALLGKIEDYFLQLRNEQEDEMELEFRLDRHGYIGADHRRRRA